MPVIVTCPPPYSGATDIFKDVSDELSEVYSQIILKFPEFKNKIYIAGGSIATLVHRRAFGIKLEVSDWDIWFHSHRHALNSLDKLKKCPDMKLGEMYIENWQNSDVEVTKEISTATSIDWRVDDAPVQFILRYCDQPQQLTQGFDFVHTTAYWTPIVDNGVLYDGNLWMSEKIYWSMINKVLVPNDKNEYNNTLINKEYRKKKFRQKGWKTWEEHTKMDSLTAY